MGSSEKPPQPADIPNDQERIIIASRVQLISEQGVEIPSPKGVSPDGRSPIDRIRLEVIRNPEVMAALPGIKEIGAKYATGLAPNLAELGEMQADIWDDANEKADLLYAHQQDIIRSIGSQSEAYEAIHQANMQMYNDSILITGAIEDAEGKVEGLEFRQFYNSIDEIQKLFKGIVDDDLLLTHFAPDATAQMQAELPLLGKALGFRTSMVQTFLKRQFALTGKADDNLLKSTLAHVLAIEKTTGVSSKIIAKNVGEMMEEVSLFGNLTEQQMARASAEVAKLGIEMSSFTGTVKSFNDFESAAGNVAKLTQALGVQLDVMETMAMANESPEQLLGYLRDQFDMAGVDIHELSMPMKRAIANMLGTQDTQEIEKMFGAASHGLDQFLADTDEGIAGVGGDDLENALAQAESNIDKVRLLKGDVDQQIAAMKDILKGAISDGLTVAAEETKIQMEQVMFDVLDLEADMLPKMIEPIRNVIGTSMGIITGELSQKINEARVMIEDGMDPYDILRKMGTDLGKVAPVNAQAAADAEKQKKDLDQMYANAQAPAATGVGFNQKFEVNSVQDLENLQAFFQADLEKTESEKRDFARLIDTMIKRMEDSNTSNDVVEIKITGGDDKIVFTPKGGTPVQMEYSTE